MTAEVLDSPGDAIARRGRKKQGMVNKAVFFFFFFSGKAGDHLAVRIRQPDAQPSGFLLEPISVGSYGDVKQSRFPHFLAFLTGSEAPGGVSFRWVSLLTLIERAFWLEGHLRGLGKGT